MIVKFLPNNIQVEFNEEMSLMSAADLASVAIDKNCAGAGTCGKCKVKILSGNVKTEDPYGVISDKEKSEGYVLACCTSIYEDVVIELKDSTEAVARKSKPVKLPEDFSYKSGVYKKHLILDKAIFYNKKSYKRILSDEAEGAKHIGADTLNKAADILRDSRDITITYNDDEIIDVDHGDTTDRIYGLAIDMGTTTGVVMLWDLKAGIMVSNAAFTNPQANYGADVISRINFTSESPENLKLLNSLAIQGINKAVNQLVSEEGISKKEIYKVIMVGNTTMSHILAGINPISLALSPFTPVYDGELSSYAGDMMIDANPNARVTIVANIAGHVGSDITAGVITTDMPTSNDVNLFIDIGTNGEIVLSGKGRLLTCSTAAGPAFEGSSIVWGMRAAAGAIEDIKLIGEDVIIKTIDNKPPIGICGSGIIDIVSELVRTGIVNKMGKLLDYEKLIDKGMPEAIANRIKKSEKGNYFVIAETDDGKEIYISQKDVREIQVAKAAILTGCNVLLNELGVTKEELDSIKIAGAFGNYIKKDSAIDAGIIPDIDKEKIKYLGNAAGIGASMILLSKQSHSLCNDIVDRFEHIELATRDDFQQEYLKAMKF